MRSTRRSGMAVQFRLHDAATFDSQLAYLLSYHDKSLTYRFIQDATYRVMPATLGGHQGTLAAELTPPDRDAERAVSTALAGRRRLADAIYSFVQECATTMLVFGEAAYEIVVEDELRPTGTRDFYLTRIPPRSLDHSGDKMPIQRIPQQIAISLGVPEAIQIPKSNLVIFEVPEVLRKHLAVMMERLAVLSEPLVPEFGFESMLPGKNRIGFDFDHYNRTRKLAIVEATRKVGWTGQEILPQSEVVEHYWWFRELTFLRFTTEFRDNIIEALNEGLSRAGRVSGIDARINLLGFPTVEEIEEALFHLHEGDRPLVDAHNLINRAGGERQKSKGN